MKKAVSKMVRAWRVAFLLVILDAGSAIAADSAVNPQADAMVYDIDYGVEGRTLPKNVAGYVQGSYARQMDNGDAQTWGLRGSANVHVGQGLNIQGDAGYANVSASGFTEHGNQYAGQIHGYYRSEAGYAAGAFFSAGQSEWGRSDATSYTWGVEAAYLMDNATVYGRAGLGSVDTGLADFDQAMGAVGARVYASDNIRFDVNAYMQNLTYSVIDIDRSAVGITANYRLAQMPLTVFAGYQYQKEERSVGRWFSASADGNILFAGARYSFGSSSLKDEERNGVLWQ